MDRGPQAIFSYFQNGVGSRSAKAAGGHEGTRVNEEDAIPTSTDRLVGMAIDDAINLIELMHELIFKVIRITDSMDQANPEIPQSDGLFCGQVQMAGRRTHVTMDSVKLAMSKDLQE